jgi:branched-chain amino acid transport system substrate-binding protein
VLWLILVIGALVASAFAQPRGVTPVPQSTERRVALVIGNDAYRHVEKLERARSDALAVGAELRALGFDVLSYTDLDRRGMNQALGTLVQRIAGGGVGLLFFAGHGVQVGGANYLLPVDIQAGSTEDLADEALDLGRVMERLGSARAKFVLLILDACRDNPFPKVAGRSLGSARGLTIPSAPDGLMVVYSAGINERALDKLSSADVDPNGLFTREFLKQLRVPGVRVDEMIRRVRGAVREQAARVGHQQNPAFYDQSSGDFFFALDTSPATPPPPSSLAPDPAAIELAFWDSIKSSTNPEDFRAYLSQFPNGRFALLARNRLEEERRRVEGQRPPQVVAIPEASAPRPRMGGTIKIATQSPLSGGLAALGEAIKLGAQLAMDNGRGALQRQGFDVALVPFDDQGRPAIGVANARNIVADREILVVIGHLNSGVAIPASEVYRAADLAMISPANTSPAVTDRGLTNIFRVVGRDDVQGIAGARFARDELKARSVYILHDKTQYGQGVAEIFRTAATDMGITVLGFDGIEERASLDPILAPIKARNPDLIYFGGIYPQAAALFRQARDRGIRARFMGPDGLDSTELLKVGGGAVVGAHFTTIAAGVEAYPRAKPFADEYRIKFGKHPEPFAAQAYDATTIALKAIEALIRNRQPLSREAVARAIRDVKHSGLTGTIEFDSRGDPRKATYMVIEVAGTWQNNSLVSSLEVPAPPTR